MVLNKFSNLEAWVSKLNSHIEKILVSRLEHAIELWIAQFSRVEEEDDSGETVETERPRAGSINREGAAEAEGGSLLLPKFKVLKYEIKLKDQVMYLDPPLEESRAEWISQLYSWLAIVCELPKIQSTRFEIASQALREQEDLTFRSLLTYLLGGQLQKAYSSIEGKVKEVGSYVATWLRYQSLWDLEPTEVFEKLGNDLKLWQQLLEEIKQARATFDNSSRFKSFGCMIVRYGMVQGKVNSQYDFWQKEVLNRFGALAGQEMGNFYQSIAKWRDQLEEQTLDTDSTSDAVSFITFVEDLTRSLPDRNELMNQFSQSQKLLERSRYHFPANWVHFSKVQGEWSAFTSILSRKATIIQDRKGDLKQKVTREDEAMKGKLQLLAEDWAKDKPNQGHLRPEVAKRKLANFQERLDRLQKEFQLLSQAKEVLNLELSTERPLDPILEELGDLKGVWTELSSIWAAVDELRDLAWASVAPRSVRTKLDHLLTELKKLPARLHHYDAYNYVKDLLIGYLKVNVLVTDLKSDALRERHWRQLFQRLRVEGRFIYADMTLGNLWDLDLQKNEKEVRDVIVTAQGELALEEYIKQVREFWQSFELELVAYQGKCRLIKGWDDLFTKCGEHLNSLTAMKLSPYFKFFEEEALAWEEKLNRINMLFDVWIDVQRQWVYLEGIFASSADIKHLLPTETSRFQSINSEFLGVMKKVQKNPQVLEVLNIPGIQRSLDRLADLLAKIQKALGEYLERERASFPRFYFVGDEDLLEIIGNSKDVTKVQKHFKKMFAGLANLLLDEENQVIMGMASKEGELVQFRRPISLKDNPKINEWLTAIEREMRMTLAENLGDAVSELSQIYSKIGTSTDSEPGPLSSAEPEGGYLPWVERHPAQLVGLATQIAWTTAADQALTEAQEGKSPAPLEALLALLQRVLTFLADTVLTELSSILRKKCEHLITELVHQRDVVRSLIARGVRSPSHFEWLQQMRFCFSPRAEDPLKRVSIRMANASFDYGFEYLGVGDKLVHTPLTDRCYLTLTQALELRLGGSPFGPAGTGKTESVKALGALLGRFVLVFCCDETFDFQAMGRIFVGLCQVGFWGCFDEFNRLEERILSAVSQQVQTIQQALKEQQGSQRIEIELVDKKVTVQPETGIFITMNLGYAGRSNLPDNLKKLFRSISMNKPDREMIAQVMLYSQGFRSAELLASKVVPFFNLCLEQLSSQPHYDFGLRALKSVLVSAGNLKRDHLLRAREQGESVAQDSVAEQEILIQSVAETVVPKLVSEDIPLLRSLLSDVFPGISHRPSETELLRQELRTVCLSRNLECDGLWLEKVLQLHQIQKIHHGLMMVGPSGSGKSAAWSVLLKALERVEGREGVAYVIDPKSLSKDDLYGTLDATTREWTDGLFTHILRKIVENVRGELSKTHWIIFDGDVDPEWVENLNSVLDDNKLLTLPNGERLNLPPCVRIMFEVQDLRYATLATVSRCGMVWFSEDVVTFSMMTSHYLNRLRRVPLDDQEEPANPSAPSAGSSAPAPAPAPSPDQKEEDGSSVSPTLKVQRDAVTILEPFFRPEGGLVPKALEFALKQEHIMEATQVRLLETLFSMLNKSIRNILDYNEKHPDFPMGVDKMEQYLTKRLLYSLVWSFSGDSRLSLRASLGEFLLNLASLDLPGPQGKSIIDYEVSITTGEWMPWQQKVPQIEIETHRVAEADVVIPTVDTVRHEEVLYTWLSEHKPMLLCGPPGSGKTMTLFSALRALPDLEVVGLNFSSATTPELILKTFEQYCEYRKTPQGVVLAPVVLGKWLVLFCDEINLPAEDKYGTQRVISFLRQVVEHGGFYRPSDKAWVHLERIQFVGACNPPTDPGRVPLSPRFLRHAPVVMVDYPGEDSLRQIYGTFNRALMRLVPALRSFGEPLTNAMVDFYLLSQGHFTSDQQAHYIYSPRELTRWVRGMYQAIHPLEHLDLEGLIRLWAHEGLRLFQDRLVTDEERRWTDENIDEVALRSFQNFDRAKALGRPILYSDWLTKNYVPVEQEALRDYIRARLKVFYEEELDVPLVLFDDVLEHVLRIDRVFKQVQGHLLLIGVSGAGKTTLSRFVAWLGGLTVFQIKVHNNYTMEDFDEDLRAVLRRAGCKGEKICFIMDESNILDSGFLERMNTLLANGEVPGLFDGDEHAALMTQCREASQREGLVLDSADELYRWFTSQIMKNLHVVFTMNPPEGGLGSRAATSPALFNRCVLDWFGDWSPQAYYQVGHEFTSRLDLDVPGYVPPEPFPICYERLPETPSHREALVNAMVFIHRSLMEVNERMGKRQGRATHITPRHYLDFIQHYVQLYNSKRSDLEEQQLHLNTGLKKLRETFERVEELQKSLAIKKTELENKTEEANTKLQQMLKDQQEAERKKAASEQVQKALNEQNKEIASRREVVMNDLSKAEPAVKEAEKSVKGIKKQHLVEIRSMANPPKPVKLALESVSVLLGEPTDNWKTLQGIVRRDDFITRIVGYDTEQSLTEEMRQKIRNSYMNDPGYSFEQINHASKACGPLVQWVIAQVSFSEILHKVEPLKKEVSELEAQAKEKGAQAEEMEKMVQELEANIASYKEEYAALISQTQQLKAEMDQVRSKVERATKLLSNLSEERDRWGITSETFEQQMGTIAGDVLLSAAFLAYAGFFDQHHRELLVSRWTHHLHQAGIQLRSDLSLTEFLSTADQRLQWQSNALPADDLCTENAIMLARYNRYPLIIDPSAQATRFLMNEFKDRKITRTSFLDRSFLKVLESALRFGNPLIIEDVENMDPILNPLLNKELRRTGGRVLIRLGSQDIDFSPSFTLFLTTRDPTVSFAPDLSSRVTFVNFTVTHSSLQAQCLHEVLKTERPDTHQKRTDLLKLQGEFQVRLRHLEKSLLEALSTDKPILESDDVITHLEALKTEATEIGRKMSETDTVAAEVEAVTATYNPFAQACSSTYFVLERLNLLNHFYQYSLDLFYDIFGNLLHHNPNLKGLTDPARRLETLTQDLFLLTFRRVSRGLLHEDYLTLALLLAQVKTLGSRDQVGEAEYQFLLTGGEAASLGAKTPSALQQEQEEQEQDSSTSALLDEEQQLRLQEFAKLPALASLPEAVAQEPEQWKTFLESPYPEREVPAFPCETLPAQPSEVAAYFMKVLVVKCLRPDRLLGALTRLVDLVFGPHLLSQTDLGLATLAREEAKASTPIAFCSVPGYDAASRVEELARQLKASCSAVAIGSAEGFALADRAIAAASQSGTWVLLKNVHLAPQWLGQLEKKLHNLSPHPSFRLFMTMETNPKVPASILRLSRIVMFERPPGIKANLQEALASISPERASAQPAERARLFFLLSWLHAVVQERLRYAPVGWTKTYEFNDSDLKSALDMFDSWIDSTAKSRSNIDPERIPWDALRTLLSQSIYGGRIDNDFDQRLLESFISRLFSPKAYDADFLLTETGEPVSLGELHSDHGIPAPEGSRFEAFTSWAASLPDRQPPTWLGLPKNAEKVLLTSQGNSVLSKVQSMKNLSDDEEAAFSDPQGSSSQDQPGTKFRALKESATLWLQSLSTTSQIDPDAFEETQEKPDPLKRCLRREVDVGTSLLKTITKDLADLIEVCDGNLKQTNHLRALINSITRGIIPRHWRRYKVPDIPVAQWVADFHLRIKQLEQLSKSSSLPEIPIWLGGLFFPEAFITATRQAVAQRNGWSLEELSLDLSVSPPNSPSDAENSFKISNLRLEGASLDETSTLSLSSTVSNKLPTCYITWKRTGNEPGTQAKKISEEERVRLPIYLNRSRKELLFSVTLTSSTEWRTIFQRGVAFVASALKGI